MRKKSLFGSRFGGTKNSDCCCTDTFEADTADRSCALNSVKVLGSGCKSCKTLLENTQSALKSMEKSLKAETI